MGGNAALSVTLVHTSVDTLHSSVRSSPTAINYLLWVFLSFCLSFDRDDKANKSCVVSDSVRRGTQWLHSLPFRDSHVLVLESVYVSALTPVCNGGPQREAWL